MKFIPFRIILKMRTAVVLTTVAPSLDGLLYEALSQRFCMETTEQIIERLKTIVAFHDDFQVFHASSMKFGVTSQSGLSAEYYYRTDVLKEKLKSSMFLAKRQKAKYTDLVVTGGPTKQRLTKRPAYQAQFVCFDAFGDPKAVAALLEYSFVGVGYDAQNCGMGEFDPKQIEICRLEDDKSLISDGLAMRPLPEHAAGGAKKKGRLRPPYYLSSEQTEAVMPPRVQLLKIDFS